MLIQRTVLSLSALLLLTGAPAADAQSAQLLPLGAGDLAARSLIGPDVAARAVAQPAGVSRQPVTFTYALAEAPALSEARPYRAVSREYFVDVDAEQLRRGVRIFTTAPGALVRLHPAASELSRGRVQAVAPADLRIITAAGERLGAQRAMETLAGAADLRATGVPFAQGTTAFRLAPAAGAGALTLVAPKLQAQGSYSLHVFDRGSDAELSLRASSSDVFHGDVLTFAADLRDSRGTIAVERMEGFAVAAGGKAWPVTFEPGEQGGFQASLPVDALAGAGPGLWELHMVAQGSRGGLTVMRNAVTSFSAALPTAALDGRVTRRTDAGLKIDIGVRVAAPGRYEVRGVLFGTNSKGRLVAFAAAHSADWLSDDDTLTLEAEPALLQKAGVTAPFEVRDLRLMDQGRMGLLHRQANAISVDP